MTNPSTAHPQNQAGRLRIAIVGGGIGGLTCAIALKNCENIQLDLYEAASEISEIGAGITVWPRTWGLLRALGLEEALVKGLEEPPNLGELKVAFTMRKGDQRQGVPIFDMKMNGGSLNFHRRDIQQALLQQLPSSHIHLNHRLVKCTETPQTVHLEFLDGSRVECDLLVGADGIKSVVRRCLKGDNRWLPIYTGTLAFRGLVPRERLEKMNPAHRTLKSPTMYLGKNRVRRQVHKWPQKATEICVKHIVVYPISQNRVINVVAFHSKFEDFGKPWSGPEVRDATRKEVLEVYEGWESEVQELLQCIEKPTCWVIQDVNPLDSYVGRRTLLLGDAAHAMTPHLGAGAGQAMEDAYILGVVISATCCKPEDILRIVQTYDAIRRPFCNYIVSTARKQVRYYELDAPEFQDMREQEGERLLSAQQMSTLAKTVSGHWSWASSSVDRDCQQAVAMITGGSKNPKL
ncbi:hypothetical protein E1B28_003297 [Marasmius oreades]|uniref:FAD-binding domain-containing protein n=1 Tax=Marasmius oreades TaxID=181124 RepID=A0A9P7RLA8_9AGAR|nr:uncharacterized protein E1B28_003297 [Marasmius oreades]KAG7085754.1 hypothetical protein E1B28_003297 [Marasmius oreades]